MTKTAHRILTLLLTLALALTLAVPALAVETVKVTGVSLDKTEATMAPGETLTLVATVEPSNATDPKVTWESNQSSVAAVKDGVVTAKTAGTADVSVVTDDGKYRAVCRIVVEDNYVTGLTITPAGPETLPQGKTRQLEAKVLFAHDPAGSQEVTWSTNAPEVATVSPAGLVTAVAAGQADIMAMTKAAGKNGTPIYQFYKLTVTDSQSGDNSADKLFLTKTEETRQGGLYHTITLNAPAASVVRNEADVSSEYALSYAWTNDEGAVISRESTASLSLVAREDVKVLCTVTAVSRTDSTKEPLTGTCSVTIQVLPGTLVEGVVDVSAGTTRLDKLMNSGGTLSVIDQLTKGGGNAQLTPAIEGLTDVTFYPEEATGGAGALNVAEGVHYYIAGDDTQLKLADVVFTPLTGGTYIIPFTASGTETYYGQLEVTVTGEQAPVPIGDATMTCNSSGLTFAGSDFFKSGDEDPVACVIFGKPSAGQMLRDMAFGSGVADAGAKYYTDSARDGDYHVSTLSYLPPAGFSGKVAIPVTYVTKSGQKIESTLVVEVKGKTASDTFSDVTPDTAGTWAADSVDFAYDHKLVNGTGDSTFSPDATMTRAMLVTVLYRAAGSPNMTVTTNFEDLDANSYYYNAVVWANSMGVINGTTDKTFGPNDPVTREQIAVILYRYAALNGHITDTGSVNLNMYTDKGQISEYAVRGMGWAVNRGIITGTTATTLSPDAPATRAQVVVMLHRYLAS